MFCGINSINSGILILNDLRKKTVGISSSNPIFALGLETKFSRLVWKPNPYDRILKPI